MECKDLIMKARIDLEIPDNFYVMATMEKKNQRIICHNSFSTTSSI